jgi:phosphoribosylaminoimidazole carboxylase (NCAIR synthetase)
MSSDQSSVTGARLGIVGGGQLARMLCASARQLGVRTVVLDPAADAPAAAAADEFLTGSLHSAADVAALAARVDVVTVEIEHVCADALAAVAASGTAVHPSPATLALVQDKL